MAGLRPTRRASAIASSSSRRMISSAPVSPASRAVTYRTWLSDEAKWRYAPSAQSRRTRSSVVSSLTFGAESKAEKVTGNAPNNYCVYLDLTFTDKTRLFGQIASFKTGTHDWEKASKTIKLAKPVKSISYYVLFRNVEGKASFRNAFLYNK